MHSRPNDDLWYHQRKVPCSISAALSKVSCVLGDGGKVCCGLRYLLQDRPCLAYSLGSAGDTTFEQEIVKRTSCQVEHVSQAAASLARVSAKPIWWRGRSFSLCETLVKIDFRRRILCRCIPLTTHFLKLFKTLWQAPQALAFIHGAWAAQARGKVRAQFVDLEDIQS